MIKIRKFQPTDLEKICEFKKESVKLNFPSSKIDTEFFKKKLLEQVRMNPDSVKVIEKNETITGYIWLKIINTSIGRYGRIDHIYIHRDYRKLGLGERLMKVAENYFRSNGVSKIKLTVTKSNKTAINFYKELGFKVKRIVMEKDL